jgi:cytochrome c biogenesis protein CcmG/thiol:disulfide interchange protein DsbE
MNPATPEAAPRRSRTALIASVVVGLVMVLLVALLITRDPAEERQTASPLIGKAAPALGGKVLRGDAFDLGATDDWVVVNFFASWCTPCIREHPQLREFQAAHEEAGDARVVSVVYGDTSARVEEFFDENGGDWTVLDDDDGRTALDWAVAKVPESFVVAPDGTVVQRFATGNGVTRAQLDAVIDAFTRPGS